VKRENRFFYGWVIVVVGFFIFALGYGVRYSFSVIFPSLLEQFGWTRDATATIFSFHMLAYGITAPIAGALVDRLGAKKTMGLGAIVLATGACVSGLGSALWHYYLAFGLLTGVGLCLLGSVPFTRVLSSWFTAKRGLALSLAFSGSGGAHLVYPLVAFLIEKIGWREAFMIEGAIVIGLLLPAVIFFIRINPEGVNLSPGDDIQRGKDLSPGQGPREIVLDKTWASTDWTLSKALKTYRFWALLFTSFAVWGIAEHIVVVHHVAIAEDAGYSKLYASSVLSLFGVMIAVGALLGFISDRISREVTFTIGTVIGVLGIIMIMLIEDASQPWMLYLYSIFFGLGIGITLPTIAASAADLFQGERAGAVIGSVWFSFGIGGTIGPWLGGSIFEVTGSYMSAFILSIVMFVLSCVSIWVAGPRHVRPVAGRAKVRKGITDH